MGGCSSFNSVGLERNQHGIVFLIALTIFGYRSCLRVIPQSDPFMQDCSDAIGTNKSVTFGNKFPASSGKVTAFVKPLGTRSKEKYLNSVSRHPTE